MDYDQKKFYVNLMNVFDLSHRGCLDEQKFLDGMVRANPEITLEQAKAIFIKIDDNDNKFIEFEEFIIAFIPDEEIMMTEVLKKLFLVIMDDKDFLESHEKSRNDQCVSLSTMRQKIEMTGKEYDNYFE